MGLGAPFQTTVIKTKIEPNKYTPQVTKPIVIPNFLFFQSPMDEIMERGKVMITSPIGIKTSGRNF